MVDERKARRERQRRQIRRRRLLATAALTVAVASIAAVLFGGGDSGGKRAAGAAAAKRGGGRLAAGPTTVRNATPQPNWRPHTGPGSDSRVPRARRRVGGRSLSRPLSTATEVPPPNGLARGKRLRGGDAGGPHHPPPRPDPTRCQRIEGRSGRLAGDPASRIRRSGRQLLLSRGALRRNRDRSREGSRVPGSDDRDRRLCHAR